MVGAAYAGPLKARVEDLYHNPIANASVTFAAPTSGASVTFAAPATVNTGVDGLATSPTMTANSLAGAVQVTATTAAVSSPALFNLTNVPGSANKLAFVQQPVNTVAGAIITPAVTVQVRDSAGNAVHTAGIMVTLDANAAIRRLNQLSGGATQSTDSNGLATFATLSISQAGAYTLQASATGLSSTTSNSFTIAAGAASKIETSGGTPQSVTVLTAFPQPLQVTVRDAFNNPVGGAAVAFAAPASGASATLSAASAVTGANGVASVTAVANSVAGSYSVTAVVGGVGNTASFTLSNLTGAPGQISFVQQPSNAAAGAVISPVIVHVVDGSGNSVGSALVTVALEEATATLGGTLSATTNAGGLATFADLSITTAGTYHLDVATGGISALSNSFQITPAASAVVILAFEGDGQSAAVGANYAGPLKARVEDLFRNPVVGASVTFAAPTTGASVTFSGSATVNSDVDGVALAPAISANSQAGAFQVTATTAAASGPALFNLTNVPGSANKLVFVQQPVNTVAGAAITPPVTVQVQDSSGNAVRTAGVPVTLQPNATVRRLKQLSGTATQSTDANGVATFADLSISQAGDYTLQADSTGLSSATSHSFTITAGTAANLQSTDGTPQSAAIQTQFAVDLQATVLDSFNNPVSGVTVTFAVPTSGASATLSAASAVTDANGHAAVTATANSTAGSYSVTAATAGVATNSSFSLTNLTGSVGHVTFVQQPTNTAAGVVISPPVTVQVTDAGSNLVSGISVTIQVQGGTPALGGTLSALTNTSGVATFADLSINTAGTYRLNVASGSISTPSDPFQISAATSAVLISAFEGDGQSAAVGATYSGPLKARVEDPFHNPIANAAVTFAAPTTGASVTFGGSTIVNSGVDGVAISPAITANSQAGAFQVTATTAAASGPARFNLTNVPGNANKLVFIQQPVNAAAGAIIAPPVTVQIEDNAGNAVHTAGTMVTVQANATVLRLKQLSGTLTQSTDANGLATFANLSISQAGVYSLQANATGLSSATSNSFTIIAGTANKLQATGGNSQSATVQTQFAQQLQATLLDALDNPVAGVTVTFAAPQSGASAILSPLSAVTDANGHAAVTATANSAAGCYSVSASAPGVPQSATYSLCNVAAALSQIAFIVQPVDTQAGVPISPPVMVRLTDASGNGVAGAAVAMSLPSGETLHGTTTAITNAAGEASFDDLRVDTAGTHQLAAVNGNISGISNSFQVSGATVSVTISVYQGDGQSALAGSAYGGPLRARVVDLFGNHVPGIAVTFTPPSTGPGATFAGSRTVSTDANGLATSSMMTANTASGPFAVTATAPNAPSPATFPLTNLQPTADQLTFVQHPIDTAAGATVTPPVIVQLRDSSGDPAHTANVPITLRVNLGVPSPLKRRMRMAWRSSPT